VRASCRALGAVIAITGTVLLASCAPTVRGRAIEGGFISVCAVRSDDGQLLSGIPVPGAQINVYRDPQSLGAELVATGFTDSSGNFTVKVSEFGAGWMDEVWLIEMVKPGFMTASAELRLPDSDDRVLIVTMPGRSEPGRNNDRYQDMLDQYRR